MFERAFGPIVDDTAAGGLELITANADGSAEQVIVRSLPLGKEPHDAQWSPDAWAARERIGDIPVIRSVIARPGSGGG